ncbi:MAG: hypothetical protein ACI8QT_002092 [Halioglobus sp.]|jgi:uncharacterized protein YbcC (UPF0753/DUF2309 family)
MNAPSLKEATSIETKSADNSAIKAAIASAVDSIAPSWPLDRMIAVNPYWGRIDQPFEKVSSTLGKIAGSTLSLPLAWYRDAWQRGDVLGTHLNRAIEELQSPLTPTSLIAALDAPADNPVPAPLLGDMLDAQRDLHQEPAWCDTITHQVSQFCAAHFDREQADWRPNQPLDLYGSWRRSLLKDHSVALLMKANWIRGKAAALATKPELQIKRALEQLEIPAEDWPEYLETVIMRLSGWAACCAYRRWQARLAGADDHTITDLLAIRLCWECLLDDGERQSGSIWSQWRTSWNQHMQASDDKSLLARSIWQRAAEISYQNELLRKLTEQPASATIKVAPTVQAAFCIDVRSEVFRRHLETQSEQIQTLGFAGFFGLPISYAPLGTAARRPQLPGLLAPTLAITDSTGDTVADQEIVKERQRSLHGMFSWRTFQSVPLSTFTVVEALGLVYLGQLVKRTLPSGTPLVSDDDRGLSDTSAHALRPTLDAEALGGITGQVELAARVLRGMGLTSGFARLVLLAGHGSQARNNPQKASLDCGACCGQTGDVNARALAGLLNHSLVRKHLREASIDIPDSTQFLAALHNTTTDEVVLYDLASVPASHANDVAEVTAHLAAAGQCTRQERAPALGLVALQNKPAKLSRVLLERANDWAQTRPEWGLANNAAFVIAPRSRTRGVNLEGRSFLHDYDHKGDTDGTLLTQIMTAPMLVTHWINMQYYASTVDNHRYGSGNKTLHNVTGGRVGVFEGNGGDLRVGLAWQSVHDGDNWRHAPLRLTVVIEAPRHSIEHVIAQHATVRQLVDNQWLYLIRLDDVRAEIYQGGAWHSWTLEAGGYST